MIQASGRMSFSRELVVLTVLVSLLGCEMRQTHEDVSQDPEHRSRVGSTCELLVGLRAHGVANSLGKDKKTDYISIWNPGFSGPERTFLVILPPGTKFDVLGARQCSNCFFDRLIEYRVKVDPEPEEFLGKPAFVQSGSMTDGHVRCVSSNAP